MDALTTDIESRQCNIDGCNIDVSLLQLAHVDVRVGTSSFCSDVCAEEALDSWGPDFLEYNHSERVVGIVQSSPVVYQQGEELVVWGECHKKPPLGTS